jgi:endonuclease/exonuclease/phosphatase (EEP) superfamily protein YafD
MRSFVKTLVAIVGALTLLGFFDRFTPYLELATFLRLQYALLLGAAALAAILLRLFPVALTALVLAGLNVLVIAPGGTGPGLAEPDAPRLRLLVLNVEHGSNEYRSVARLIAETDPDVVGLTELTPAWATGLETALERFPSRRLEPDGGAYGIGLYSKLPFAAAGLERFPADGPPSVVATLALGGEPVDVVLTHVHTPFAGSLHARHLRALAEVRDRLGDSVAVCGDFNAVPWSQPLRRLTSATGLRSIHDSYGLGGTWPTAMPFLRVPIDNCLVSEGLIVLDRHLGPDVGSDHFPLIVDLALAPSP